MVIVSPPSAGEPRVSRPWLQAYPAGVPAGIPARAIASLPALAAQACARFRERPAFTHLGGTLRFGTFERLTRDFAAHLQAALPSPVKGERIAIMLPNSLQYPVVLFGALRAGMVVVNVNPRYTASELAFQLRDSGAVAVVVLENFAQTVQQALPGTAVRHVLVTGLGDLLPAPKRLLVNFVVRHVKHLVPAARIPGAVRLRAALADGRRQALDEPALGPADAAFLQYTGGTTGRPKGALLSHGNLVANVLQTTAWTMGVLRPGREVVVTPLPLYHVFELTANLMVFVHLGGRNVLVTDPRDLHGLVKLLRRTPFTVITGVNTLFDALLAAPGFAAVGRARRGKLKLAVSGGMAVQAAVARRWQEATGTPLLEGYGLTETSPIVCANPVDATAFSGKLGLPVPSTEVAIRDSDGHDLPPGEAGEICVRGPQVMQGYWRQPEETAAVLSPDGWLRTGDIGRMDERGWVEFVDRSKDIIVVSGFKAFPGEIEEVARRHPGIVDAGAVGVPDARSGEAVALFVVARDPALTAEEVRAHCARHLTGYKQPRTIEFRTELPRTPLGKVLHRQLKEEAARAAAAEGAVVPAATVAVAS
jgi:long-chain acyl-CoA synthetase